jgi:LPPG:FO 2-phospho-L-lactate transferase
VITVVCGGVGAARLLAGLVQVVDPAEIVAIGNTGDDLVLHGLSISPDLDTITYTLAGEVNPETGWGRRGESWSAMAALEQLGGPSWFRLGDRDLGTHLFRTGRLAAGGSLTEVTAEIATAFGLGLTLLPMSDDPVRTRLELVSGEDVSFQEYFVRLQHDVAVRTVRFDGADAAHPAPGVLEALEDAARIVIAPSNPVVSIGPVLAVPGIRAILRRRRADVTAISPIVGGAALKGPADRLLRELGAESSAAGVAAWLADVAATLIIDEVDRDLASEITRLGVAARVTETVMRTPALAAALAAFALDGTVATA